MKFNEVRKVFLDFFKDTKVRSAKTVWEEADDGWKWVLTLHNLNWGEAIVIYTKFIIRTDENKDELLQQQFSYLYDLNCKYRFINFNNEEDLAFKLEQIIFKNQFGEDIQRLSKFIENPTMRLNDELARQEITDYTVFDINYSPRMTVVPCKYSSFDFKFDINNTAEIKLNISKNTNSNYLFRFKFDDETTTEEVSDLSDIEKVIIDYIKQEIQIKLKQS